MVLFAKISDELEMNEASMGGIIAGLIITFLYGLVFFKIYSAYASATMTYDRELANLMAPYWVPVILSISALVLTLIFWKWKSRVAIIL